MKKKRKVCHKKNSKSELEKFIIKKAKDELENLSWKKSVYIRKVTERGEEYVEALKPIAYKSRRGKGREGGGKGSH